MAPRGCPPSAASPALDPQPVGARAHVCAPRAAAPLGCPPCRYLPPETQVVLVSATLPAEVLEMTNKFMTDPIRVLVKRDELTLEVRRCAGRRVGAWVCSCKWAAIYGAAGQPNPKSEREGVPPHPALCVGLPRQEVRVGRSLGVHCRNKFSLCRPPSSHTCTHGLRAALCANHVA